MLSQVRGTERRSLGGRRRCGEKGEDRGLLDGANEPGVAPWVLEAMPGEIGFSAMPAGALSAALPKCV
jgi:hypothetical protein